MYIMIGRTKKKKKTYTLLRSVCLLRMTRCRYIRIGFCKNYIYARVRFQCVQKRVNVFLNTFVLLICLLKCYRIRERSKSNSVNVRKKIINPK